MFKNLILYRIDPWNVSAFDVDAWLLPHAFKPCEPTQPASSGFTPPRGHEHGALVEVVGGHCHLQLTTETRILPAAVVTRRVDELAAKIEHDTGRAPGRAPGRRERRDLKEQATLELLPQAFTRRTAVRVWIDRDARLLAVDASSVARAEDAVTALVRILTGLVVRPLQTQLSPAAAMSAWLLEGEAAGDFGLDRDCELKAHDEIRAAVRYTRHNLDMDEVREHIKAGKQPTRLALGWRGRVSFVLTDTLQVKRIAFDDVVMEGQKGTDEQKAEAFDADAAIATGELSALIAALVEVLGGDLVEEPKAGAGPSAEAVDDELLQQALVIARAEGKVSISLLQARLRIGYNRAARLVETMEALGHITPENATGGRKVTAHG